MSNKKCFVSFLRRQNALKYKQKEFFITRFLKQTRYALSPHDFEGDLFNRLAFQCLRSHDGHINCSSDCNKFVNQYGLLFGFEVIHLGEIFHLFMLVKKNLFFSLGIHLCVLCLDKQAKHSSCCFAGREERMSTELTLKQQQRKFRMHIYNKSKREKLSCLMAGDQWQQFNRSPLNLLALKLTEMSNIPLNIASS